MNLPVITNALQNIKCACQNRLTEIYPKGLPADVSARYEKELSFLEQSDIIDDFEIFRRLSEETKKSSNIIGARGTLPGSILYFLLGNNCFNPLHPHYYCTECGYYEKVDTQLFGIDLPPKKCPNCNTEILADGYNLPVESVWGNNGEKLISFEYNVTSEFIPIARHVLQSAYPNNEIVPWYRIPLDSDSDEFLPVGNVILPTGKTIQDFPGLTVHIKNGVTYIAGGSWELKEYALKPVGYFLPLKHFDKLTQLQCETGICVNDIGPKELRDITWHDICNTKIPTKISRMLFDKFKPNTYKDMVAFDACSHNSFSWQENEYNHLDMEEFENMLTTDTFKKYPCFTREDFFDHMIGMGVERSLAFDASEAIRKGYANSHSSRFKEKFEELPIPDEFKELAQNYLYVFPRAHCIVYILIYARLAYYTKTESRDFS